MSIKQLQFLNNTIDTYLFQIEDVNNDNACFYRSMANSFNLSTLHTEMANIKSLKDVYASLSQYKDAKIIEMMIMLVKILH